MNEYTMNDAVERQQKILADTIPTQTQENINRSAQFLRYLFLLSNQFELQDTTQIEELILLEKTYFLTPSYKEAIDILDAGGQIYGL